MDDFDDDVSDSSGDGDTSDHGGNGDGPLKCVHCGFVASQLSYDFLGVALSSCRIHLSVSELQSILHVHIIFVETTFPYPIPCSSLLTFESFLFINC